MNEAIEMYALINSRTQQLNKRPVDFNGFISLAARDTDMMQNCVQQYSLIRVLKKGQLATRNTLHKFAVTINARADDVRAAPLLYKNKSTR